MDIYLSINNREQVIRLPVVPAELKIKSETDNPIFNTIALGDIKLLGLPGLKALTIDSFFPQQTYKFVKDTTYKGWEYVEIIEEWRAKRVPIRLVITGTPINLACSIDSFEYGPQDGTGDVYYTMALSEFKFITLEQKVV